MSRAEAALRRNLAVGFSRNATYSGKSKPPTFSRWSLTVGNPPFLGDKKMIAELGEEYTKTIRKVYKGRVPGGADFVTFWFTKAYEAIKSDRTSRTGLVSTNSIRGGKNQKVLTAILEDMPIFEAWGDEPWVVDGAAVRVSLIGFGKSYEKPQLDGKPVNQIHADLASSGVDLTKAGALSNNKKVAFIGGMKKGSFDISGIIARNMISRSGNPNGLPNTDVILPWLNGLDVTRRPSDKWIIDFGVNMELKNAMLYEAPFQHVVSNVKPTRDKVRNDREKKFWWLHARPAPELRNIIEGMYRFIATPRVAKHRLFVWLRPPIVCDGQLIVVARDDDVTFGILHSRFHELWSLKMCTWLGVGNDPRYTPTTCFETFPFPNGFDFTLRNSASSAVPQGSLSCVNTIHLLKDFDFAPIAQAAKRLDELRNNWLNPPEWVERIPEVVEGFPDRIIAKPGHEADLKKRTLTNLYNARPAWLDNIHKELDAAVAAAYGWDDYTPDMPDEEILALLFVLNQKRASK